MSRRRRRPLHDSRRLCCGGLLATVALSGALASLGNSDRTSASARAAQARRLVGCVPRDPSEVFRGRPIRREIALTLDDAIITVALLACLTFGIVLLASGDWLPGGIIVAASTVGLARLIPVVGRLCSTGYRVWPAKHKPVK